jgi:hypothetical protein
MVLIQCDEGCPEIDAWGDVLIWVGKRLFRMRSKQPALRQHPPSPPPIAADFQRFSSCHRWILAKCTNAQSATGRTKQEHR